MTRSVWCEARDICLVCITTCVTIKFQCKTDINMYNAHARKGRKKERKWEAEGDRYGRMSTRLFDGVCIWPCLNSSAFEFYDMWTVWSTQSSDTKRILLFTCSINNFPNVNVYRFLFTFDTHISWILSKRMNACHPLVPQKKECENRRQTDIQTGRYTDQWSMSSLKIEMKSFDNNNKSRGERDIYKWIKCCSPNDRAVNYCLLCI